MIFVDRSRVPVPEVLLSEKAKKERRRIESLLSSDKKHLDQLRIKVVPEIYLDARPALTELFHSKCAYCETALGVSTAADVEHFRPKEGAEDLKGKRDQHYYAWLAYEWDNLLLSCSDCGRRRRHGKQLSGKASVFPVIGSRAPILAAVDECRRTEKALLLDPCHDRPEEHLLFLDGGLCSPQSQRGEVSIEVLGLNRMALVEARQRVWERVSATVRSYGDSASLTRKRVTPLEQIVSRQAPHAAAARAALSAALRKLPRPRTAALTRMLAQALAQDDDHIEFEKLTAARAAKAAKPSAQPVRQASRTVSAVPRHFKGKTQLPAFAHQRIARIEIHNFKAIEHLELELPDAPHEEDLGPAILLLGENACGKSTILEATALTLLGTEQIEQLQLDASEFLRRVDWKAPLTHAEPAEVAVYFSDDDNPVRLTIDPNSKRFRGARKPATVVLAYGPRRFFTDKQRRKRSAEPAEQVRTMFDPLAVIENPKSWLMNAPQSDFDAAVRALRQILLLADEAIVERPPEGKRRGQEIMFEVQGDVAPLNRLSEGYRTIVATGVDVMREMLEYWPDLESAKGVVLIDEVETHLHPRWKMRIVQRLRRAMPQVQFIATTHDPLCLRGLFDGEAQVLQRDEARRIEKLVEVPNVRGMSVEQLLTSEFFGLFSTEDPGLEDDVARYAELAAKRNRSPADDAALARQRENVAATIMVGAKPQDQLVHEAANEYLLQRQRASAAARPDLKREAISRVVDIWKSIDVEEDEA